MKINARIQNSRNNHQVTLQTGEHIHSINIPPKAGGFGSSVNGGELLLLALATCYCNDIYREAAKRNIKVDRAKVEAQASEAEIRDLMRFTDTVAEIHNTFRVETPVVLSQIEAISA